MKVFCAIDIIMHNVFNSSCENKINLIISYKHNFSYMLDIQNFAEENNRAAACPLTQYYTFYITGSFPLC